MLATLNDLLPQAAESDYAVTCFNVFGYEDARAVVTAAETLSVPVILAANRNFEDHMGAALIGPLLRGLAEPASVPVCVHLDHCYDEQIIKRAIDAGFTSVMFDGSQLPLAENIERTRGVAEIAHACGVSVEGEIGSVAYHSGNEHIKHELTDPKEAQEFARESGVDAVAISIGNVHRVEIPSSVIDYDRLNAIVDVVDQPLVLHGVTGTYDEDLGKLRRTRIAKCNVGTSLRMAFGNGLREAMVAHPTEFDKLFFFQQVMPDLEASATATLRKITWRKEI